MVSPNLLGSVVKNELRNAIRANSRFLGVVFMPAQLVARSMIAQGLARRQECTLGFYSTLRLTAAGYKAAVEVADMSFWDDWALEIERQNIYGDEEKR